MLTKNTENGYMSKTTPMQHLSVPGNLRELDEYWTACLLYSAVWWAWRCAVWSTAEAAGKLTQMMIQMLTLMSRNAGLCVYDYVRFRS